VEDRKASIIVTKQSVIIHKNQKAGLEITPRTRRYVEVRRDRIELGSARRHRPPRAGRSCRRTTPRGGE